MRLVRKLVQKTDFLSNASSVSTGLTLALTLGVISSCTRLPPAFNEARILAHFEKHREIYAKLEMALPAVDASVESITHCPPSAECTFTGPAPSPEQMEAEAKILPLLEALEFPGPVNVRPFPDGRYEIPQLGSGRITVDQIEFTTSSHLVLWPDGLPPTVAGCDDIQLGTQYHSVCYTRVDGNWFIRREILNETVFKECSDRFNPYAGGVADDDSHSGFNECLFSEAKN